MGKEKERKERKNVLLSLFMNAPIDIDIVVDIDIDMIVIDIVIDIVIIDIVGEKIT